MNCAVVVNCTSFWTSVVAGARSNFVRTVLQYTSKTDIVCFYSNEKKEEEMEWCLKQPKIELHAHLNGSIRDSTLLELAKVLGEKGAVVFADVEHVIMKNDRSLVECFKLFDLIHLLTTDHETVTRITKEVIEDFAAENIIYVELRTTPKDSLRRFETLLCSPVATARWKESILSSIGNRYITRKGEFYLAISRDGTRISCRKNEAKGMTKRSYVEAVINGFRAVDSVDISFIPSDLSWETSRRNLSGNGTARKHIFVRLLLSIDRRESTMAAMETVQLALELRDFGVVGIDLSGNPVVGNWDTFVQPLLFAREKGLPITLHCGEVKNRKEVQDMLDFVPQRIGHAIFLEEQQWKQLKLSKIPVEICLTSNVRTECVASIDNHHFVDLYESKHPIALCTDDTGVFSTSLSQEYMLAASAFDLGEEEMFNLGKRSIEFVFADEAAKKYLRERFDSAAPKLTLQKKLDLHNS